TMDATKDELKARPGGHQDQDGEVKGSGRSRSWLRPRVGCHRLRDLRTDRADNSGIDKGSIVAVRGDTTKRFCRASAAVRMSTMIGANWLRAECFGFCFGGGWHFDGGQHRRMWLIAYARRRRKVFSLHWHRGCGLRKLGDQ